MFKCENFSPNYTAEQPARQEIIQNARPFTVSLRPIVAMLHPAAYRDDQSHASGKGPKDKH